MVQGFENTTWTHEYQKTHNVALEERSQNLDKFKPGVEAIVFVFSNRMATKSYFYPWFDVYKEVLIPIVDQV